MQTIEEEEKKYGLKISVHRSMMNLEWTDVFYPFLSISRTPEREINIDNRLILLSIFYFQSHIHIQSAIHFADINDFYLILVKNVIRITFQICQFLC